MSTKMVIGRPSEKQFRFMRATTKYVGFGGARGGGKSWAVQQKAKIMAIAHPGIRQLIVRRTYPELINNHIRQLRADLKDFASYNDNQKIFTFKPDKKTGKQSVIMFAYCARDADLDRLQGTEYDIIYLDEATQLSEFQMRAIEACLRGANDFPKRMYFTMNPGGQGHAFIKRIFIDRQYKPSEHAEDYTFIQSLVTDNKALMEAQPDYIKQLEALPPKLRKAWLEGDWNVFEGQFFEEFRDDPDEYRTHRGTHVIEPFAVPVWWTVIRSFDWGYNKPFSMAWYAIDPDGVMYRVAELYGCTETPNEGVKWTDDRIFAEARRMEETHPALKGHKITGVADPAIWDASHGVSTAETAAKHRIYFTPGDHARIAGWMQCHYRLAFDANGRSMFYVFSDCKQFIRTIPQLCYDEHKLEDVDTSMEDHIADEWRYACMSRPITPRLPEKPVEKVQVDPLDLMQPNRKVW